MADSSESPSVPFDWRLARLTHRGNLPHVRQEGVIYFVTFRLGDCLPAERTADLRRQRDQWLETNPPPLSPEQAKEYRGIWTAKIENLMDAGHGRCELAESTLRDIVEKSMRHDDGIRYDLGEFVIMPNHVHALLRMRAGSELSETIKAWKSISARRIGKLTGRDGSLWMEEYFDHAVRNDDGLRKIACYIRNNPVKLRSGMYTLSRGGLAMPGQ